MELNKSTQSAKWVSTSGYDEGLRAYMLRVYNYMAMALGITGVVAYLVSSSPALMATLFGGPLKFVVLLAPLGIVIYLSIRIQKLSMQAAQAWFWAYSATMGLSLATIFAVYTEASVARAFFITASIFGGMSLYGYTTKKDLTSMGSFLIMGLFGIIIASLVNIFLQSSALNFVVSALSVIIFTGLTAYDTQKLKEMYYTIGGSADNLGKATIMGALTLYLDFINLMIAMLRFVGDRK